MANETVTIGCKLPHGLVLEMIEPGQGRNPAPGGERHELKGANSRRAPNTNPLHLPFATTVLPRAFWEAWKKRNADLAYMKNGSIFEVGANGRAVEQAANVRAAGKERALETTGFEPIDPLKKHGDLETDPRVAKLAATQAQQVEAP